jgi:uncharacterized paraquat-inducible protein A
LIFFNDSCNYHNGSFTLNPVSLANYLQDEKSHDEKLQDEEVHAATIEQAASPSLQSEQPLPSHFKNNTQISKYERYGLPIGILCTMALLLASDIGSGVLVVRELVPVDDTLFTTTTQTILHASVFTSVASLWKTGSYALVIFIVLTSISWPYVKMLLTLYAWMTPFSVNHYQRRERLLIWLDALGKWSFVDIFVFLEITVVFRSTINLGGPSVEVYVLPRYGIFGFVCATMLSLMWTQYVLQKHRSLIYRPMTMAASEGSETTTALMGAKRFNKSSVLGITVLLLASCILYITGCILSVYQVSSHQGSSQLTASHFEYYSIVKLGADLPYSSQEGTHGRMTWLAIVWFGLGVFFPLFGMILCAAVLYAPLPKRRLEQLFAWTEVCFAWSSAEVFCLSTIFAITQVPKFGNGLIKSGCVSCYVVSAALLPNLVVLIVATVAYVLAFVWLFRLVHPVIFDGRLKQ